MTEEQKTIKRAQRILQAYAKHKNLEHATMQIVAIWQLEKWSKN
jgi:hypothetical protein